MLTGEEPEPELRRPPAPAVVMPPLEAIVRAPQQRRGYILETRYGTVWTDATMRGLRSSCRRSTSAGTRMDDLMHRDEDALVRQQLHADRLRRGSTVARSSGEKESRR